MVPWLQSDWFVLWGHQELWGPSWLPIMEIEEESTSAQSSWLPCGYSAQDGWPGPNSGPLVEPGRALDSKKSHHVGRDYKSVSAAMIWLCWCFSSVPLHLFCYIGFCLMTVVWSINITSWNWQKYSGWARPHEERIRSQWQQSVQSGPCYMPRRSGASRRGSSQGVDGNCSELKGSRAGRWGEQPLGPRPSSPQAPGWNTTAGRLQASYRESHFSQMEMMLPRTVRETQPDPLLRTSAQKSQAHPPSQQEWMNPKPLRAPLPAYLLMVGAHPCPPRLGRRPNSPVSKGLWKMGQGGWSQSSEQWAVATGTWPRWVHEEVLSFLSCFFEGAAQEPFCTPSSFPRVELI